MICNIDVMCSAWTLEELIDMHLAMYVKTTLIMLPCTLEDKSDQVKETLAPNILALSSAPRILASSCLPWHIHVMSTFAPSFQPWGQKHMCAMVSSAELRVYFQNLSTRGVFVNFFKNAKNKKVGDPPNVP
jgi:hypothetical protein